MIHTDITGLASPGDQPNTHYRVISLAYCTWADSLLLILFFPLPTLQKVLYSYLLPNWILRSCPSCVNLSVVRIRGLPLGFPSHARGNILFYAY